MKRTPLSRKSELKRTGKLKPGKHVTYGTPDERYEFRLAIVGQPCVVCGRYEFEALVLSGYRHQAHHAVEQAHLKRNGLAAHLWDPRNAVPVCEEPCHRRHTSRKAPILLELLPACVHAFAAEHGLEDYLARVYPSMQEEAPA